MTLLGSLLIAGNLSRGGKRTSAGPSGRRSLAFVSVDCSSPAGDGRLDARVGELRLLADELDAALEQAVADLARAADAALDALRLGSAIAVGGGQVEHGAGALGDRAGGDEAGALGVGVARHDADVVG